MADMEKIELKLGATQPRKIFQCYKREWEKLPIFKDWLTPVPGNRHKAYCKFCRKQFRAHRTDLRSHARSRKHQKAGDAYYNDSIVNAESCQVAIVFKKDHQSGSVAGRSENIIISDEVEHVNVDVDIEESYVTTENREEEEEEEEDEDDEINKRTGKVSETDGNEYDMREDGWKTGSKREYLEAASISALGKQGEESETAKGISTQVLDLVRGVPVSRLGVTLLMECGSTWSKISDGITDGKGHCTLLKPQEVVQGRYKINYEVRKYFTLGLHDTIYPFIEVTFDVANLQDDYHIPLLLSPCGYMVYRVR